MLDKKDLKAIDTVVADRIKKEIKPLKEDVVQIRKDVKSIVNFFDKEYLKLRERVERIEDALKLPPLN